MELNLLEMWHAMNPIVKSAVVVLTIQGIWGVTVTVDRLLMLLTGAGSIQDVMPFPAERL